MPKVEGRSLTYAQLHRWMKLPESEEIVSVFTVDTQYGQIFVTVRSDDFENAPDGWILAYAPVEEKG